MVRVRVNTAKDAVVMKALKLEIVCEETITLPSSLVRLKMGLGGSAGEELTKHRLRSGKFTHCETTYDGALELQGPMNLKANNNQVFNGPIALPDTALPNFQGRCITNQWRMRAVLETSSGLVNPKSEWMLLPVSG